jgi:hypothetical protein
MENNIEAIDLLNRKLLQHYKFNDQREFFDGGITESRIDLLEEIIKELKTK